MHNIIGTVQKYSIAYMLMEGKCYVLLYIDVQIQY